MTRLKIIISCIMIFMGISFSNALTDEAGKPSILGGRIWSGSDTLDLGEKESPDSLELQEAKEEEFFTGEVTELPARTVSAKTEIVRLKLSIPRDLKFLEKAPVVLKAKSSDPEIIEIGEGTGKNPEKGFIFPIKAKPGKADIFLYYRVVCCTNEGREACFFKEAKLKVPVEIGDYEETVVKVRHDIED